MWDNIFTYLWLGWGALFFLIEFIGLHFGDTADDPRSLSANLRDWFHTNTTAGRSVWAVVFGVFAGWFAIHIAGGKVF